jgi:hypothetical protein
MNEWMNHAFPRRFQNHPAKTQHGSYYGQVQNHSKAASQVANGVAERVVAERAWHLTLLNGCTRCSSSNIASCASSVWSTAADGERACNLAKGWTHRVVTNCADSSGKSMHHVQKLISTLQRFQGSQTLSSTRAHSKVSIGRRNNPTSFPDKTLLAKEHLYWQMQGFHTWCKQDATGGATTSGSCWIMRERCGKQCANGWN